MSKDQGPKAPASRAARPAPVALSAQAPKAAAARRPAATDDTIIPSKAVHAFAVRRSGSSAAASGTEKGDLDAFVALAQEAVSRGEHPRLEVEALSPHWRERFSEDELNAVVIPRRTLARRVRTGEPLTAEETDRALRLARIATHADRVFGDRDKAARWLRKPNRAAGQQAPIALLETETGAKLVEDLLVRIEYGVIG